MSSPLKRFNNNTRKRTVLENEAARDIRQHDQYRLQEQEKRRKKLLKKLELEPGSKDDIGSHIVINLGKEEEQDLIHLNSHIGRRIQPHQIEGVQFMWREIVQDVVSKQGCLLAHTMGLGKTMQVYVIALIGWMDRANIYSITLLVTIGEAVRSPNPKIHSQISAELKAQRTLVVCPPTLIDNWWDEFLTWAPMPTSSNIGDLRRVDAELKGTKAKLSEICAWYEGGGVLLITYTVFRRLVSDDNKVHVSDEDRRLLRKYLLEGASIIIADEAHKLKNEETGISKAAALFKSKSRIAMTGSPLANNLLEYYSMINWIAPGYLGPIPEFKAKFVEPIEEGCYMDATRYAQRKSLKMLLVLKKDLEPKVNRADNSILRHHLEPKTEFLIRVPLTKMQYDLYSLYLDAILKKTDVDEVTNNQLWALIAVLRLFNNHPLCFHRKLEADELAAKRIAANKAKKAAKDADFDEDQIEALPILKTGISGKVIDKLKALMPSPSLLLDAKYSHKTQILEKILDASKAAGDKVLVFSQSIPTLNVLEELFIAKNRKFTRLDGKTAMKGRQESTKEFNAGKLEIFLISTKAGGLGLNLYGANRIVLMDFDFNPSWEEQAVGRAYRIGQKKAVFVYRLLAGGTFEDIVHNTTVFKRQLASRVVDKKNPMRQSTSAVKDYLREPAEVEQRSWLDMEGRDPKVLDKILEHPQW
jgi:SNF2 family DNA or RNA helicase